MNPQVDGITFLILARDMKHLEQIYRAMLPQAPAFNPAACQKSIVISSKILPEPKPSHE